MTFPSCCLPFLRCQTGTIPAISLTRTELINSHRYLQAKLPAQGLARRSTQQPLAVTLLTGKKCCAVPAPSANQTEEQNLKQQQDLTSVRILKALKGRGSLIVMMNSSVPSNASAMKKQQNIPGQSDCPLYTADDTHTESALERALGWVCPHVRIQQRHQRPRKIKQCAQGHPAGSRPRGPPGSCSQAAGRHPCQGYQGALFV